MNIDYIRPAKFAPGQALPLAKNGTPLAFPRGRRLYGVSPPRCAAACPYCGRSSPAHGKGTGKASGFRKVGFANHMHACYEKELLAHGLAEAKYVASADAMMLYHVEARR